MINGIHTLNVLLEVAEERAVQDETWGQQDHPVHVPGHEDGLPVINGTYAEAEQELKQVFSQGYRSGAVILLEEVMEALAARSVTTTRAELVQVAAVAVMMVEAIDRETQRVSSVADAVRQLTALDRHRIPDTFKALSSQDCPHCGNAFLADRLAGHIRKAHPETVVFPAPHLTAPLLVTTEPGAFDLERRWIGHGTDPYDAVGGDLEALEKARGILHRAPLCGREAATCAPCPEHAPVAAHPWNGEGRLHGICRCGEGRDAAVHQCSGCAHPTHDQVCMIQVAAGGTTFPEAKIECGCITGV